MSPKKTDDRSRETRPRVDAPERWQLLTIEDIMRRDIISAPMSATAREIEQILTENEISGLGIRDAEGRIVGIVSWRDVMSYFAQSPEPEPHRPHDFFRYIDGDTLECGEWEVEIDDEVTAADFMNTDLLSIPLDSGIREAARLMCEHRVHRLLVTDAEGSICGLISTMDILDTLTA